MMNDVDDELDRFIAVYKVIRTAEEYRYNTVIIIHLFMYGRVRILKTFKMRSRE